MRRHLIYLLLLVSIFAHAATSLRVGNKVLTVGDSAARVLQLMGEPSIRAFKQFQVGGMPDNQLANGEEWQYLQDGKTIIVTVVGGRVVNFETVYD
ncbi:DUF2845 domain-containing protein [Dyella amyloliquefaciens]|uniref:DUF2845 domain-containing protein n=1 Tax=Dyella amyloliquefaciens TaxID=1770545 RepID=UPI00102E409E|nr:DUF2845 domain-containing protein [Dyella amyloliquefaciens]